MLLETPSRPPATTAATFTPPRWAVWTGILALFFTAVAPTLSWLEFSGGLENLNIATALELRRDHPGNWLVPTLEGEIRVKKPPLAAWLTAAAIRPATVAEMSSPDPAVRDDAARRLAFETRWPSLLAACLMLVGIYELGRAVADPPTGLLAALAGGTMLMFLRFGRSATIDVSLGLWVTLANVALAHAILHDRRWLGCVGAGLALGLAFLAKGPVGLVQSLVPALAYASVRWWREGRGAVEWRRWLAPALVGLLLMLAVALPWYVYVIRHVPGGYHVWLTEAIEERGEKPSRLFEYLSFLPFILPWTVSFIGGVISARRGMVLAAFLAIAPLVLLTLYKDRKERYMYPATAAAAVVAAGGVLAVARKREPWNALDRAFVAQHWGILVAAGVVFPAVAATTWTPWFLTIDGQPWLPRAWGAGLTVAMGTAIAAAMLARRNWVVSMTAATVVVMLTVHAAAIHGYARTEAGLSPMRPLAQAIWRAAPDAQMYNAHPKGKRASVDLSIYLNRVTELVTMDELARLQPGPRPKVVVMLQDNGGTPPTPPAGWTYLDRVPRDKDFWWAFVLPASVSRASSP
jgi:4-amino-4-deoxy-L-arabinose transferase-like glycosyltransferase